MNSDRVNSLCACFVQSFLLFSVFTLFASFFLLVLISDYEYQWLFSRGWATGLYIRLPGRHLGSGHRLRAISVGGSDATLRAYCKYTFSLLTGLCVSKLCVVKIFFGIDIYDFAWTRVLRVRFSWFGCRLDIHHFSLSKMPGILSLVVVKFLFIFGLTQIHGGQREHLG